VTSSPIKGTVPAHADPAALTSSTKDVAENVMIVDLVRNDLGRVARTGSVTVPDLLSVAPAPGVWHLVSTVQATLRPEIGNTELLTATFPPASVTGTPKIRAAELLADWEHAERGVYCGAIGIAGPNGLLDLSVAIRTVAVTTSGELTLGVGGGITIDSDPDAEWQECLDKASSIVSR
jgi:para-aminobenzoate synthetase component 1